MRSRSENYPDKVAIAANQNVKEREYWLNQLSGDFVKSRFPYDFNKENENPGVMDEKTFEFSSDIFEKLKKLSDGIDVKLHMILVAGLVALLYKYSGSKDISIGSPIPKQDIEGEFINTILVYRNQLQDIMNFKELILQVRETIIKAVENQNYPVELLPGLLNLPVLENEFTLFDIALLLENIHDKSYLEGVDYNMLFSFHRLDNRIEASLGYNSLLYQERTVKQVINHYVRLLDTALSDLNVPLNQIDILSEEEKQQLLKEFNANTVDFPKNKTFHQLFEEQVEKMGHQIALVGSSHHVGTNGRFIASGTRTPYVHITYRELNEQSNHLAWVLWEKGVQPDNIIGLMVDRSIEMIIGVLGILKSGGAYLPLDPTYPKERINFMLKDSNAGVLLKSEIRSTKSDATLRSSSLRSTRTNPNDQNSNDQNVGVTSIVLNFEHLNFEFVSNFEFRTSNLSSSNLAYVIYTSGSTGKPKGVLVEHRNVVANLYAFLKEFKITPQDTVIQLSSYTFDAFIEEVFPLLMSGGKIAIPPGGDIMDMEEMALFIQQHQVTIIDCTPLLLNEFNKLNPSNLDSLRFFISGGDVLKPGYVDRLAKKGTLYNTYGPTETTVCASYYKCPEVCQSNVPIGKPISNYRIYILDNHSQLLPIGVTGELCISGAGVSRGYLNNPELTAEKFDQDLKDYQDDQDNKRNELLKGTGINLLTSLPLYPSTSLYRTGDLARWLADGNLEFLGRMDNQVKVRGYRIELGEIDNRLLEHPDIKKAVVVEKITENDDKYLCGYVISDKNLESEDLRDFLGKKLPDYMVPWFFVQLEQFPLTPNGKIDKKSLPEPETSGEVKYVAPRDETEKKLVELWSKILGKEKGEIGIDTNFFDLGGNSLKAIMLTGKMHKELNVKLQMTDIFIQQTIRSISELIKGTAEDKFIPIEPVEEKEYYKLSSAQKRLYILQQMELDNTAYNTPQIVEIQGELEKERLNKTFCTLIERHESLRTSFEMMEGEPVQRIHKKVDFRIEFFDITTTQVEAEGELDSASYHHSSLIEQIHHFIRPFNLSNPPLLRVGLIKTGDEKYILMVDMHHIISDGVSNEILLKDFISLYEGEKLPPLNFQYKNYSEWQNSEKEKEVIKEQQQYWLKQFEGEIPVIDLPSDYIRPVIQGFEGSTVSFEIAHKETNALNEYALKEGSTLYMVLLAIFNIFLSKISCQEEIVVGTPIAGRRHADLEQIIGIFINTLALKNHVNGQKTFKEFHQDIKERALDAFDNQDYQYENLVEQVAVNRDASRNPLFDVMFILQDVDFTEVEIPGLKLKPYAYENKTSKFELTLTVEEMEEKLLCGFEYSTKLFKGETIQRFINYFKKVTSQVLVPEKPGVKISEIEIITDEEKKQILVEFNNTDTPYPCDRTLHQLFEEQVDRAGDNIAVIAQSTERRAHSTEVAQKECCVITYNKLNEKSNQLAQVLMGKGVRLDTIVGIMMERTLELIIGILGILKAGGAYLPIDPDYPVERIHYILADSNAGIVLTTKNLSERIAFEKEIIYLENYNKPCPGGISSRGLEEQPATSSLNLAYVIYTSGSTGKPKGVMVEHQALVNFIYSMYHDYGEDFGPKDNCLSLTNICFDVSVCELFLPFSFGSTVVLFPDRGYEVADLVRVLVEESVTFAYIHPGLLRDVSKGLKGHGAAVVLNKLLVGVEPIKDHVLEAYASLNKAMRIVNGYGPTEATICATTYQYDSHPSEGKNVPIGSPLSNTRIVLLDKDGNLVPVGVAGQLCIASDGLARGYLNRPALTTEKFIENSLIPAEKMYLTGDLARRLPDGNIVFSGRIDDQVKIRGFRVEPGEIAHRLQSHEKVKEAFVMARADQSEYKYLCAYIVSHQDLLASQLREYLSAELPEYMIPSYFVRLEKMPLTSNGKVDRKALPEPKISLDRKYKAPRNKIEEAMIEIWAEVLDLEKEKIGINSNFFELGGHSLKATIMIAKIHKEFNINLPLAEIFKTPSIRGLAKYIKEAAKKRFLSIEPAELKEYYPLSSAQKRMYVLQQMKSDSNIQYNIPSAMIIKGKPDKMLFENVFHELIKRHESLRTSFQVKGEEAVQVILNQVDFKIEYFEASNHDVKNKIRQFFRPFKLDNAPLFRVGMIQLPGEEWLFLLDVHHIISDEVSIAILVQEFTHLYQGETLPELKLQFKDFSQWQDSEKQKHEIVKQETYWLKKFAGKVPVLNLPTDYPRPKTLSFEGDIIGSEVSEELTDRIKKLVSETNSTLFITLLTIFNILLYRYTGQEDIVIGTGVTGRNHADLQHIIGMFVNSPPLRNYLSGKKCFIELLKEVKESTLNAFENRDYHYEELVQKLGYNRDPGRNPLYDVIFALQNIKISPLEIEGLGLAPYPVSHKISKFDLTVMASEVGNRIGLVYEYRSKLFKEETISRMNRHFINIMEQVVINPGIQISEINMIKDQEVNHLKQKTGHHQNTGNRENNGKDVVVTRESSSSGKIEAEFNF